MAYVRDSSNDLVWDSGSGQYVPAASPTYTLTVIPTPSDATVTLEANGYTTVTGTGTQSITVDSGVEVHYTVEKINYETEEDDVTVTQDDTISITINPLLIFTVNPTPSDATVTLTASGFYQSGNSIYVSSGTVVSYTVAKNGYVTVTGTETITSDYSINVPLTAMVVLTVSPTPSDATVTLEANGYTTVTGVGDQSIEVDPNTSVSYTVERTGYQTVTDSETVTTTHTTSVSLTAETYAITVTPTPSDATVTLIASGYTTVTGTGAQTINVEYNTQVIYTVEKTGYNTATDTIVATQAINEPVTINVVTYVVEIRPTPSDATVVLTATGYIQSGNTITVGYGTAVSYSVSKQGYTTQTGSISSVTENSTIYIDLTSNLVTLQVVPDPADATVVLTATGYTQTGNYISVDIGTAVSYSVSKTGYETISGSYAQLNENVRLTPVLRQLVTFTITPTPADATVTLTCSDPNYTQTPNTNSITVPAGESVTWTVSKQDYITQTNTTTVTENQTLQVSLLTTYCTLTIVPTPSDATVVLTSTGATQSGNTITVANGASITYTVSKTGYVTQTNTISITYSRTLNVDLLNLCTLTIAPIPSNATVVLTSSVSGYTQSGNTITVPNGTTVSFNVSATGYITKMGNRVVTNTHTETIALTSASTVMDPLNVIPNVSPSSEYGNAEIETDFIDLLKAKVDSFQGTAESGKVLAVDTDGYVKLSQGLPGFVANWGEINGTLSDQTDLQNALNLKANDNAVVKLTGNQTINNTKTFTNSIILKNNDVDHTVAPTAFIERLLQFDDVNGKRIGSLGTSFNANDTTVRCYIAASKEINGSYVYSVVSTYVDSSGNAWAIAPAPAVTNSVSESKIATTGWVNDPSKSTNVVHRTGNETIAGVKTFSSTINGTCTNALWADLAEQYESDEQYPVGTLICFGGEKDITIAKVNCNGVISEKPGFLLDSHLENSQPVALVGKTPIRVIGKIKKFDRITLSEIPGVGKEQTTSDEKVIAIALEDNDNPEEKLVKCVTKFTLD